MAAGQRSQSRLKVAGVKGLSAEQHPITQTEDRYAREYQIIFQKLMKPIKVKKPSVVSERVLEK